MSAHSDFLWPFVGFDSCQLLNCWGLSPTVNISKLASVPHCGHWRARMEGMSFIGILVCLFPCLQKWSCPKSLKTHKKVLPAIWRTGHKGLEMSHHPMDLGCTCGRITHIVIKSLCAWPPDGDPRVSGISWYVCDIYSAGTRWPEKTAICSIW